MNNGRRGLNRRATYSRPPRFSPLATHGRSHPTLTNPSQKSTYRRTDTRAIDEHSDPFPLPSRYKTLLSTQDDNQSVSQSFGTHSISSPSSRTSNAARRTLRQMALAQVGSTPPEDHHEPVQLESLWNETLHLQDWLLALSKSMVEEDLTWNEELRIGGFLALDPIQELRMRLTARAHPILTTFGLLSRLLCNGARFQIYVLDSQTYVYRPTKVSKASAMLYSGDYSELPLPRTLHSRVFFQGWATRVTEILQRPHATAYLFHGGLLWRIALEYGPEDLVEAVTSGPSEAVTAFGIGMRKIQEHQICDTFSPFEMDVVVGKTETNQNTRWWWPPPDVWEDNHPAWTGGWNDEQEKTFQNLLEQMRNGTHKPRNLGDWAHYLSRLPCENLHDLWKEIAASCYTQRSSGVLRWDGLSIQHIDRILDEHRQGATSPGGLCDG